MCTTGISGAFQGQIFGISGGKSVRDMNCERIKLSKTVYDMGMKVAAVSLMCQDDWVFQAMEMAGTPCPYMGKIGSDASEAWNENAEERPDYKDNKKKIKKQQDRKEYEEDTPRREFMTECKGSRHTEGEYTGMKKSSQTCRSEWRALDD